MNTFFSSFFINNIFFHSLYQKYIINISFIPYIYYIFKYLSFFSTKKNSYQLIKLQKSDPIDNSSSYIINKKTIIKNHNNYKYNNSEILSALSFTDNNKLKISLIPKKNWNKSLSFLLPKKEWKTITNKVLHRSNYTCEVCGKKSKNLEVNEIWTFNLHTMTQTLSGLESICKLCHLSKHLGFTRSQLSKHYDFAKLNISKINNLSNEETINYIDKCFRVTKLRNSYDWDVEYDTFLKSFFKQTFPLFNQTLPQPPGFIDSDTIFTINPFSHSFNIYDYVDKNEFLTIKNYIFKNSNNKCHYCKTSKATTLYPSFFINLKKEILTNFFPLCSNCNKAKFIYNVKKSKNNNVFMKRFNHIKTLNKWDSKKTNIYIDYIYSFYNTLLELNYPIDTSYINTLLENIKKNIEGIHG